MGQYLGAVVDATLGSGVAAQVAAFRAGFDEVRTPEGCASGGLTLKI